MPFSTFLLDFCHNVSTDLHTLLSSSLPSSSSLIPPKEPFLEYAVSLQLKTFQYDSQLGKYTLKHHEKVF